MKVGILGGGAIGLHIAAQLHGNGKDVTVICRRKEQADVIRREGLQYEGMEGQKNSVGIKAIAVSERIVFDAILITVKQHHMKAVIPYLQGVMETPVPLVCFQNGIGHEELLSTRFPHAPLFYGITTEGALRTGIAEVRHTGRGTTWLGEAVRQSEQSVFLDRLLELFEGSGMNVEIEKNMKERIWKKLIINSCINPLTALLEMKNGQVLEQASTQSIMESLFDEARTVAELEGIQIDPSFMKEIVNVCRNTYHNKSSMYQDIEAGRPTEIEYINGALERIGARHGFRATHHSLMAKLIMAKQGKP